MFMAYIICCDFDGVLHGYQSGWKGADVIPDPPVPGAMEWLSEIAFDVRFEVHVYSSRSKAPRGVDAMQKWLAAHLKAYFTLWNGDEAPRLVSEVLERLHFPTQKPAAAMTIDDRAFRFEGDFPSTAWLLNFKPWNKR